MTPTNRRWHGPDSLQRPARGFHRRWRLWTSVHLSVFAVVLAATAPAFAQSADDLNRAAGALFEKGDFTAASRLLEVVLRVEPSAKAHRNLALCYAKMPEHEERGILHIQAYLRARPDAADRADVEKMVADLDEQLARRGAFVAIESLPERASVYLDDDPTPLGVAPFRARISVGPHMLRFEQKGFETVRRPLSVVSRQELRVAVALTPAHRDGAIVVRADQEGAVVNIDSRAALLGRNVVNPGAHQVKVCRAGFKCWEAELRVEPGGTSEVVARLQKPELSAFEPPRPLKVWRWVALGVTAAVATLGVIGYTRAVLDRDRAAAFDGQSFASSSDLAAAVQREQRSAGRNSDLANIGLAAALVTGATAFTFFVLDWRHQHRQDPARPQAMVVPLPGGAAASLSIPF